jgi:hypothetical protein
VRERGREGELKIKFENERMRVTERKMENFFIKKKKRIEKKNWRGRGIVRKREKRSEREGEEE